MDILSFIKQQAENLQRGVTTNIPKPIQRFAGQVKLPTQLNPFATSTPTTRLGKFGKSVNPLNPINARNSLTAFGISKLLESTGESLDPDIKAAIEFGVLGGPLAGVFRLGISAGAAGAEPARERQLIEESQRYFAQQPLQNRTQAPSVQAGPRVDAATTQAQFYTNTPAQSPRVIPMTLIKPPAEPPVTPQAIAAAQTGFAAPTDVPLQQFYAAQGQLGREMVRSGELPQKLQEAGLTGSDIAEWARANPALAYREMMKRQKQEMPSVD